jgi:3-phenylpropionate/cinnamic acid dioxygenase small subunit
VSADDIGDVLLRYATGIDRRQWDVFRSCFTDDCLADYGDIGTWHGADEITEWMRTVHDPCGPTLHRITNIVVDQGGGDRASSRCYVDAIVFGPEGSGGAHAVGYYEDELVRTGDGWRISRRRFTPVHMEAITDGMKG